MTGVDTTVTGQLIPYGWRSWAEIVKLLDGFATIWGDLSGMHVDAPLPADCPAYTHLWGWRADQYARVRLDPASDQHVLALYVVGGTPPPGGSPPEPGVEAAILPVRGWGTDPRVISAHDWLGHPPLQRLVTHQLAPITFVRPAAASAAS